MYETVKGIADEYVDQLKNISDQIEGLLIVVNDLVQQTMKTFVEQVSRATAETRQAAEASKKKVENQINKYKEKLSGLQKVLEGPSYVADKICTGAKSAISWVKGVGRKIKKIFSGKRKKRNACGIPPVIPNLDVSVPDVNLEALKNLIESLDPDIDLIDFDWNDIMPALKHSSVIDIRKKLKEIINGFFSLIQEYCDLAKKIFYLSIILIIWDAVIYMRGYYSDLSYDNMFVDDYLRELWRSGQKEKITPLRKWELNMKFQYSAALKLSKAEVKRILIKAIPTLLFSVVAIGIVLADLALSTVLQLFRDEAKFGISFNGMEKGVSFESLIPELESGEVDLISLDVRGFNLSTDPCLPSPKTTNHVQTAIIAIIIIVCSLSCLFDAYTSRLRAKICNMCFPTRARQRAEYLYKRIRTGRKTRRIQLSMIVSRELDIRKRKAKFFSSYNWLKEKLTRKRLTDSSVCPGCNSKIKQGEGHDFALTRNNVKTKTVICKSCFSDVN